MASLYPSGRPSNVVIEMVAGVGIGPTINELMRLDSPPGLVPALQWYMVPWILSRAIFRFFYWHRDNDLNLRRFQSTASLLKFYLPRQQHVK